MARGSAEDDPPSWPPTNSSVVQQPARDCLGSDAPSVGSLAVLEASMEPAMHEREYHPEDETPEQLP